MGMVLRARAMARPACLWTLPAGFALPATMPEERIADGGCVRGEESAGSIAQAEEAGARARICIQKIEGECQVLYRSCPMGCDDWPLHVARIPKVAPPPGAGGVIAGEPDPGRRARLAAAYLTAIFPECLRHPIYPMPNWMRKVLADYEERLAEIDADEGAEDLAECTA
jgi:hypothetical protein